MQMALEWKTKIEEAQAQHDLQLEKKNLAEHHYEATSLVTPIRRLPDEILGRALLFVIPDVFKWDDHQYRIVTVDAWENIDIESLYLARLHLLRVCRRWKRVLYECPAAWTSIIVDSEVPLHITQCSLKLSKAKLLDVYISGRCRGKDVKETADLLVPYMPQVDRLALLWPPMATILSLLRTGQENPLRSLKSFYIPLHLMQLPTSTSPQWNDSLRPVQEISVK
ncbi:hypothetical protein M422DRAFT_256386 [Sphaerobolus stellatus SS14]|uniref:Unplaced genomic scaffold SPHSTscaffold_67, whole genome shotgun sequence n=1 Tax=Sphaerobolus stellatus (strain SS14) TaxID=990650 RepID=A0A0C9VRR9_SPHS4|nr:hypothetical protein M422DRAFT_256386 [Sphaerobolus stellatus SS14]